MEKKTHCVADKFPTVPCYWDEDGKCTNHSQTTTTATAIGTHTTYSVGGKCNGGHTWTYSGSKDYVKKGTLCDCGKARYEMKQPTFKLNPMSEWVDDEPKGKVEFWKEDGIYNIRTKGRYQGVVELSEKQLISLTKKLNTECLKISLKNTKKVK